MRQLLEFVRSGGANSHGDSLANGPAVMLHAFGCACRWCLANGTRHA